MRLLAIDAALGACSVALIEDGRCLGVRTAEDSRSATSRLSTGVQVLFADHGSRFDAVAVTVGPGSFTGIRGALALANGLALGAGVPVIGVTVAEALLAAVPEVEGRHAWIALDTRRSGRVFLGHDGEMAAFALAELPPAEGSVLVIGDAAAAVAAAWCRAGVDAVAIGVGMVDPASIAAVALRRMAGEMPPCPARPLYVEAPETRAAAAVRPPPA